MTSRQMYDAVLIELNKENAPNILLESFNYFANKAINQYINKRYNIYDINLQTTDDLRVLKATALLKPIKIDTYDGISLANAANYEVVLPPDYLHLLNCICIYDVKKTFKCYNKGETWRFPAKRLTADLYSQVLDNFWNKPDYKRPYYYIHNVNQIVEENQINYTKTDVPTNPVISEPISKEYLDDDSHLKKDGNDIIGGYKVEYNNIPDVSDRKLLKITYYKEGVINTVDYVDTSIVSTSASNFEGTDNSSNNIFNSANYGTDANNNIIINGNGLPKSINIGGTQASNVERGSAIRYGNVSQVRMEIRYGTDNSVFDLKQVYVDYIKSPQHIRLTQKELDYTEDHSQMLEFPDYVCQEIINELVHLIMANIGDPNILVHPVVTLSIANPAQQLTEPQAQQAS